MFDLFRKKTWEDHFAAGRRSGEHGDFARAEACFREAIRLAPEQPYPHYELGFTLALMQRFEEAAAEFRGTDRLAPGFLLVQTDLSICEQILRGELSQESVERLRELQQIVDGGGVQGERACQIAREVIEAAPRCPQAHFFLGKALMLTAGAGAEQSLRRCLELEPDETTAIDAKTHLGILRRQAGAREEARRLWRSVIANHAGNPHVKMCEFVLLHDESPEAGE